jgi:hypothetical protein
MHDSDNVSTPTRYGVLLAVMKEYGWSWADLCDAPNDLVEEIAARLTAERHWTAERAKRDAQWSEAQAALNRH